MKLIFDMFFLRITFQRLKLLRFFHQLILDVQTVALRNLHFMRIFMQFFLEVLDF